MIQWNLLYSKGHSWDSINSADLSYVQRLSSKCITTIGETIIGTSTCVLCREVYYTVSLSRRVHYRRFHCNGYSRVEEPLTHLFAMNTMGILSSSSCSRTILFLSFCTSYQLSGELIAKMARNASPLAKEESLNSMNSSWPAVSMISTSCWSNPYSICVM